MIKSSSPPPPCRFIYAITFNILPLAPDHIHPNLPEGVKREIYISLWLVAGADLEADGALGATAVVLS